MSVPDPAVVTATSPRSFARRDQILSAARQCFRHGGFHATSMAELAKAAGMSVGHIYHYFESKDAIIEAIVDRDLEEAMSTLDEISRAADVVAAFVEQLEEPLAKTLDVDRATLRMEVLAEAARNPRIAAKLRATDATARRRLTEVVARAPALQGADAAEVAWRVDALIALFEGVMVRAFHNPGLDRAAAARAISIALRALLTSPA